MKLGRPLKLFFCTTLILAAHVAVADDEGDWRIYSEEVNGDVYFFDASQVDSTADLHTVSMRILYKTSVMGASSYQSLVEIDCSGNTERILERTFFSDRQWQKPAMSTDTKPKPERPIVPNSPAARLFDILCGQ